MDSKNTNIENPSESIESQIQEWRFWVIAIACILLAAYFVYFSLYLSVPASKTANTWGEFGDFFGGILNPLVAFAAFFWLTQSVKLQKIELAETRLALEESALAQSKQAENSDEQIGIAARTALINAFQGQIDINQRYREKQEQKIIKLEEQIDFYQKESKKGSMFGASTASEDATKKLVELNASLKLHQVAFDNLEFKTLSLFAEREMYLKDLRKIVLTTSSMKKSDSDQSQKIEPIAQPDDN